MAENPTTGIDYDVDRFAIWQESQGRFVNLNAQWPRPDGGPIQGANPDYRYYKRVTAERPVVDHRYTVSTTWERIAADPAPPEGHPAGEYRQTHAAEKLPVADLKTQVETEFQRQVRLQFPATNDPSLLVLAGKALAKQADGAALTTEEQSHLAVITSTGNSVDQLVARRDELNAAIDADEDYDITDGWVAE